MKLELKIELLKFCSAVFNTVFLVLGLSAAGCATWILFDKGSFLNFLPSEELRVVAVGLLVIGGVVVAVSVAGCVAASGEVRFLLLTYLSFLVVLVLGQLFITLLLLINRQTIEQSLSRAVSEVIIQYEDNRYSRLMDNVQQAGGCCGWTGGPDWLRNTFIQSLNLTGPDVLPCSCFQSSERSFNSSWCSELLDLSEPLIGRGNGTFAQGCSQTFSDWLQENALTIIGMDVTLLLLQVVQFIMAVNLYRAFGARGALKQTNLLADGGHTPTDEYGEPNYAYNDQDGAYMDPHHLPYHHGDHGQVYVDQVQNY